jgi:uncharacterized protein with ParB-like and HNH nuclease domain
MGLKPYDRTISQIFNNIQYDVDFYQREYKWNESLSYKPVSNLIKDIFYRFDLEKYNPNQEIKPEYIALLEWYFLNSFMTNKINGKKYIVDGQQRLTTLTLMLIALYHLANKYELKSFVVDKIKSLIMGSTEFGFNFWMGFKDRNIALEDIYNNSLAFKQKPRNVSEKNIYENYKVVFQMLNDQFDTAHRLHMFVSYFNERILLIETEIDKDKDVAMVFEVINDRGVPLKPYEILKGKLLSQINISDRDKFVEIWDAQIGLLENIGEWHIDNFFAIYFRGKYSSTSEQYQHLEQSRYHKSIFMEEFDCAIHLKNNEKNVRLFIEHVLPYYIKIYVEIFNHSNCYSKEYEYNYFNSQLNNMDGQYVLTMSAIALDDSEIVDKFKAVAKSFDRLYSILNLMNSYKSNEFGALVIGLIPKIRDQDTINITKIFDDLLNATICKNYAINDLISPYRYDFFKNVGYNTLSARFLRYYFARIDHYISDNSDMPEFGTYYQLVIQSKGNDIYHIEHIITNNEKNISLFADEEEFNVQRNRLGGLLLLKGKNNISSGDELYPEKLKTYNVVGTYYARTLLDDMYHKKVDFVKFNIEKQLGFRPLNSFGKDEIEERHKILFNLSKMIWS